MGTPPASPALGAGLPTPPTRRTGGLLSGCPRETFGRPFRRGQETRAERRLRIGVKEAATSHLQGGLELRPPVFLDRRPRGTAFHRLPGVAVAEQDVVALDVPFLWIEPAKRASQDQPRLQRPKPGPVRYEDLHPVASLSPMRARRW